MKQTAMVLVAGVFGLTMWCRALTAADSNTAYTATAEVSETAANPAYRVADGKLLVTDAGTEREVALGNAVVSVYEHENTLYIALGPSGVAIMPLGGPNAKTIIKVIPVSHGAVTGLLEMDGALWMKVNATTAVQLYEGDGAALTPVPQSSLPTAKVQPQKDVTPASPDGSTRYAEESASVSAKITQMHPGKVTLDTGAADGIKAGDHFEVYREGPVSGSGVESFTGEQTVAVLVVEAVNVHSSLANIWRGDRLRQTDKVRLVRDKKDASLIYPRKFEGIGEFSTTLRPIINVGASGFGALCDLAIAYYAPHFFVDFRIQPLGLGRTEGSRVVTNSMVLSGGYNGRAFAVGMGVGMSSVNGNLAEMMQSFGGYRTAASDNGTGEPDWEQTTRHAFSLAQRVRLGAQEGLNITVNNTLLYYNASAGSDTPSGFIYAGTTGRVTWPLALRTDMFLEGGGGVMGFGFGALGVFVWLRGNGDEGSLGLSASAGAAGIWSERERDMGSYTQTERVTIVGPMFSLGLNYRFAGLQ